MRAVTVDDFGAAPVVTDVPMPKPGPGEVLLRVHSSSVNGFDLAVAGGMFQGMLEHQFPVVLGKDFAGTVEAVEDGVSEIAPGDSVFGVLMKPVLAEGAFGEYVVVGESLGITHIPDTLGYARAGALGLAGTAALNAVDTMAPISSEQVLIVGATGGVGTYAIQLAAARGATVIATARPGTAASFVRGLGASYVVDHTGDLAAQVRAIAPNGVTAALHLAGEGANVAALVAPGGRLVSTLFYGPDKLSRQDITATAVTANPDRATLDRLAADVVAGQLRVPITQTYALTEVPQAMADFAAGTIGKLSIDIS
jgi:NADPH:quinone reductase